jgi:hypothetical protein
VKQARDFHSAEALRLLKSSILQHLCCSNYIQVALSIRVPLYVANNSSASLMQPSPRNSDDGDLQDEEVILVGHWDS